MKSGKKIYSMKNVVSTFYDDAIRHPFSAFTPENMPILRENQYNYIRFDTLNPPKKSPEFWESVKPLIE